MIQPGEALDPASFRGVLDLVLAELRERIVSGEIPPGRPLRQRDLADEMGVSREPIKQAMRILATEGLVVWPPRRSAMVAPITHKLIQDVYEVRSALDAVVARRAARLGDSDRRELCRELSALVEDAATSPSDGTRRLTELDKRFHFAIYAAADNDVATSVFSARWIVIGRAMSLVAMTGYFDRAWKEHRGIRAAIEAGDPDEAASLAEAHGSGAAAWLLDNVPDAAALDLRPLQDGGAR